MNWKRMLLKLSGINSDVTDKQTKVKNYDNTPLRAEFTGDKHPSTGNSAEKDVSAWKSQYNQYKSYKNKSKEDLRSLNSTLLNERAGRAEDDHDDSVGKGAAPKYKTSTKYRIGAKFASVKTNTLAIIKDIGTYSSFEDKIASGEYRYVDAMGKTQPDHPNLVVVAYVRPEKNDNAVLLTSLSNFYKSFRSLENDEKLESQINEIEDELEKQDEDELEEQDEGQDNDELEEQDEELEDENDKDIEVVPEDGAAYYEDEDGNIYWFTVEDLVNMINDMRDNKKDTYEDDNESSEDVQHKKIAKSPPHSEYTVREMKKYKNKIDNPYALAWWMHNKGYELHDTKPKKSSWKTFLTSFSDKSLNLDEEYLRSSVHEAGGIYRGIQELPTVSGKKRIVLFDDPETKSTLAMLPEEVNVESVKQKLESSREKFGLVESARKPYFCKTCETAFTEKQLNFHNNHDYELRDTEDETSEENDMQAKEASNVDFQKKPDGTINITIEDSEDEQENENQQQIQNQQQQTVPQVKSATRGLTFEDGYRDGRLDAKLGLEPSVIAKTSPHEEYARGYTQGYEDVKNENKSGYSVGSTIKDEELGEGKIESIDGDKVIANFGGKLYETSLSKLG